MAEDNPFDPSSSANPFANQAVTSASDGGYQPPAPPASGGGGDDPFSAFGSGGGGGGEASASASEPLFASAPSTTSSSAVTVAASADTFKSAEERERDLDRREAALREREEQLLRREARGGGGGGYGPNYPPCMPVIYHNIKEDIAPNHRPVVRRMFYLWQFTLLGLWLNFVCQIILWTSVGAFLWSALYAFTGTWGSWNGWYMGVYRGFQKDSTTRFLCFFIVFLMHVAFSVFVCLGFPGTSVVGVLTLIDFTTNDTKHPGGLALILAIVNVCLWMLIGIASIFLFFRMRKDYGDRGKEGLEQVRNDAAKAAAGEVARQAVAGGTV